MNCRFESRICQNLSKFKDRKEFYRRENRVDGLDSLPLRLVFYVKSNRCNIIPPNLPFLYHFHRVTSLHKRSHIEINQHISV